MGTHVFKLPDVGEGATEAEIVAWHVKPGYRVTEDQHLVDVMTDKAVVEMTSPVAGVIVSIHGEVNERAAVGSPLVVFDLGEQGSVERVAVPVTVGAAEPIAPSSPATTVSPIQASKRSAATASPGEGRSKPMASPAVRRRAFENGVALQFISGTGPSGRVTQQNLDSYLSHRQQHVPTIREPEAKTGVEEVKVVGLRRKIAERMQDAKRRIPHITYVEELDLTELDDLRAHMNATKRDDQPKLTLLPFFVRALVRALPHHPAINARFDDEAGILRQFEGVHCGIATQTLHGLLVPVVRHAEALDVWTCAAEIARLSRAARDGKATREELSGSTITITSLGALGGVSATHVINHPEVAIIGPNKLMERPVVRGGGVTVRRMMNLSSSFDHRIVDGHEAAAFVQRMKALLERPATLFIDLP
jgi:2-oxoisovalerate dehydrogenase E2 component (dihydrolipoyl transacylase)